MKRIHHVGVVLVGLVLIAGCVDVTITTTVDSEAEIEQLQVELAMDEGTYQLLLDEAQAEGYADVSEWIAADVEEDLEEGAVGSIDHEDREANGQWIVRVAFDQLDTAALDTVTVTETEEGTIRYVDTGLAEWAGEEDVSELTYQMAMPGEIVETNADRVADDTNTAIWDVSDPGSTPEEAFAESEADEGFLSGLDFDPGLGELLLIGVVLIIVGGAVARRAGYSLPGFE